MNQSINDIKLNGLLVEALYGRSLVESTAAEGTALPKNEEKPAPAKTQLREEIPALKFLGNNAKKVTILVNDPANTFMPENHLSFLTKILGACQLNIGDVAIVNTAHSTDPGQIIDTLEPSKMISFGTELITSNIDNISAPPIKELIIESAEAKAQKSKLWSGLKKMFGV